MNTNMKPNIRVTVDQVDIINLIRDIKIARDAVEQSYQHLLHAIQIDQRPNEIRAPANLPIPQKPIPNHAPTPLAKAKGLGKGKPVANVATPPAPVAKAKGKPGRKRLHWSQIQTPRLRERRKAEQEGAAA
jgi:hypothetical protein